MAEMGKLSDYLKAVDKDEMRSIFVRIAHELDLTVEDLETIKQLFIQDLRQQLGEGN